ncbi:DUF397 domain-containing protein [Streptomyces subrutilus]|uniref:DUF397 domain-containing protein n=1 Tax=Streptomyces subrutilus TaxID=36818 RepID=A0A1E5NXG5_9ACTN|nr:DUF397 domain-containing protein [Streptomyces subrutilus]OEJ20890.1 hypothetical protein BGK67_35225 [Streptomyces subrutilus]
MALADDLSTAENWFTSSYSDNQGGNCVQALVLDDADAMAVRDSKDPVAGTFVFGRTSWNAFLDFVGEATP